MNNNKISGILEDLINDFGARVETGDIKTPQI